MFWDRFKRSEKDEPSEGADSDEACAADAAGVSADEDQLEAIAPSLTTDDFIDSLFVGSVVDGIDNLLYRELVDGPEALTGLERYAARLFAAIDAGRLRTVIAEFSPDVGRLGATGLFWFRYPASEMTLEDVMVVLQTESTLNRLVLLTRRLAKQGHAVQLASTSERACSEADQAVLCSIAQGASAVLKNSSSDNEHLTLFGTTARRGGNWDVITRCTEAFESLALPFRLEYRVLADAASGLVAIHVNLPAQEWFPRSRWSGRAWEDCGASGDAAVAYDLRLAMLVAAVAFGSGVGVSRVIVDACEPGVGGLHFLLDLSRMKFLCGTLPAIEDGRVRAAQASDGLSELLGILAPDRWAVLRGGRDGCDSGDTSSGVAPEPEVVLSSDEAAVRDIEDALRGLWRPLVEDDRPLPEDLRDVLFADVVSDLEAMEAEDEEMLERFERIDKDAEESPLLAMAQLEDIMNELTATLPDNGRSELYCDSLYGRFVLSLVQSPSKKRYNRSPDYAMRARIALFKLYLNMGDSEAALRLAQECRKIAPTSTSPYCMLLDAYERAGDEAAAVDAAKRGLVPCLVPDDADCLYCQLARLFEQMGHAKEALAAVSLVRPDSEWSEDAQGFARILEEDVKGGAFESWRQAEACVRAAGVPIAPSEAARKLAASLAIELADAGLYAAAAPMTNLVGRYLSSDGVIGASYAMRNGVL